MGAYNLATKYSPQIAQKFVKESFTEGNASDDYDFVGVRSIKVYTPISVGLNDYNRTASSDRFGITTEMMDDVQEMALTQDKGFSASIDNGTNSDQMNIKGASKMLKIEISEQVVPLQDKYRLGQWVKKAGTIAGVSTPTKSTIITMLKAASSALDNALVPSDNRIVYIPVTYEDMVELSDEFQKVQATLNENIQKGFKGTIFGMQVIRVPDSYFPANAFFLITHKRSVLAPNKIKMTRILDQVKGIDGNVLEGRYYYDAFVLMARSNGVYAAVNSANIAAAPTITAAGGAITQASATTIYYTTDGSDPRYSFTRQSITSGSAPTNHASGMVVKAYAEQSGSFDSPVITQTLTS